MGLLSYNVRRNANFVADSRSESDSPNGYGKPYTAVTMVSTRKITADKRPDHVFEQTLFLSPTFNRPNQHPRVHADHPDHPW